MRQPFARMYGESWDGRIRIQAEFYEISQGQGFWLGELGYGISDRLFRLEREIFYGMD